MKIICAASIRNIMSRMSSDMWLIYYILCISSSLPRHPVASVIFFASPLPSHATLQLLIDSPNIGCDITFSSVLAFIKLGSVHPAALQTAAALKGGFDAAVHKFGRPLRLRADMAFEAQSIGQDMLDHRDAGAYLTGRSTANQVLATPVFSLALRASA